MTALPYPSKQEELAEAIRTHGTAILYAPHYYYKTALIEAVAEDPLDGEAAGEGPCIVATVDLAGESASWDRVRDPSGAALFERVWGQVLNAFIFEEERLEGGRPLDRLQKRLESERASRFLLQLSGIEAILEDCPLTADLVGTLRGANARLAAGDPPWDRFKMVSTCRLARPEMIHLARKLKRFDYLYGHGGDRFAPISLEPLKAPGALEWAQARGADWSEEDATLVMNKITGGHPYLLALMAHATPEGGRTVTEAMKGAARPGGPLAPFFKALRLWLDEPEPRLKPSLKRAYARDLGSGNIKADWSVLSRFSTWGLLRLDGKGYVRTSLPTVHRFLRELE